jgi:hypothetical protein
MAFAQVISRVAILQVRRMRLAGAPAPVRAGLG